MDVEALRVGPVEVADRRPRVSRGEERRGEEAESEVENETLDVVVSDVSPPSLRVGWAPKSYFWSAPLGGDGKIWEVKPEVTRFRGRVGLVMRGDFGAGLAGLGRVKAGGWGFRGG